MNSMSMSGMSMSMSGMPMSTATSSGMGSMATGMSSGMDSSMMSMMESMMADMTMSMSQMNMTFFTSTSTPLYSDAWTPASTGAYAGTCIFLIALSALLRLMYGLKCMLEAHWSRTAAARRYIATVAPHRDSVAASRPGSASDSDADIAAKTPGAAVGTLTVNGTVETVRIVDTANPRATSAAAMLAPFKLNTDLPRALFVTVMIGVAYLLMLAVMTMNVGYFMSVLGGAFLGELLFGRWAAHSEVDHH